MNSGFNYSDYPVIVGIDFGKYITKKKNGISKTKINKNSFLFHIIIKKKGTTYSGASYSFVNNDSEVIDIVKW